MASFVPVDPDEDLEPENLWVACTNGDVSRLQQLLSEGSTVNQQDEFGFSPMHAAVSYCQVELLRVLLGLGADVNIRDGDGDTPLLVCETPEVFEILVAAGADPRATNTEGEGILQKAIEDDNEVLVQYLIEKGFAPEGFTFTSKEGEDDEGEEVDFGEWNPDADADAETAGETGGDENAMQS